MRRFVFTVLSMACGLFTLLMVFAAWVVVTQTLSVRDTPLSATIAEGISLLKSGKSAWVQLTDANADCQRFASFANSLGDGVHVRVGPSSRRTLKRILKSLRWCMTSSNAIFSGVCTLSGC